MNGLELKSTKTLVTPKKISISASKNLAKIADELFMEGNDRRTY